MLSSIEIIEAVANEIAVRGLSPLVVDPVMVAKSGDRLLREDAIEALRSRLLPLATVVTPNVPEAEALTGRVIASAEDARAAARDIIGMGARAVVVKGGHLEGLPVDLLYDGSNFKKFSGPRIDTTSTHGTGCTFASAIAAGLAKGLSLGESVGQAKAFVTEAMHKAFAVGSGHGPLHHFFKWWD
jgi:hydroxymethylpyrimidine/phosphomethylpyrimidine kinase